MQAVAAIDLAFKGSGLIERMTTDGRTTINLDVPDDRPDAANKRITADTVRTYFNETGKDLARAEAIGSAELYVEPKRTSPESYYTTVSAPRFDCEFFPTGNNARVCVAGVKTRTVRKPTVDGKPVQTLVADRLTTNFNETTRDVENLEARGSARFTEGERNAAASAFSYNYGDRIVRLRDGEPTFWDARLRARGKEIDWNTQAGLAEVRGSVSTTIYNAGSMNGSSPFANSDRPVFVTSETARFDQNSEVAVYSGKVRAWQDDNFVRSDSLTVFQREGRMLAEGNVQSALYDSKLRKGGKESSLPVFASARKMTYERDTRRLSYRENVDIKQGTDRIVSSAADVFLDEKNEVTRTVAEGSVVLTQPGRKAVGDSIDYNAQNEVAVLRGNPASVTDAENGSTEGREVTVYLRNNSFTSQGAVRQNTGGRVKSVYRVKNPQ
jgi:lipopolysaccharide export system protein LptA